MGWGLVRLGVVLLAGLPVAACSSTANFIGDNLPVWAGGLPPGTPPRAGTPEYDSYLKSIGAPPENTAPRSVQPAAAPMPARPADVSVDQPIH
jgi:hypothetical protein